MEVPIELLNLVFELPQGFERSEAVERWNDWNRLIPMMNEARRR
jgi:hypothetical protein